MMSKQIYEFTWKALYAHEYERLKGEGYPEELAVRLAIEFADEELQGDEN